MEHSDLFVWDGERGGVSEGMGGNGVCVRPGVLRNLE